MLIKKHKIIENIIFTKVPWSIGSCLSVCDLYISGKECSVYSQCCKANNIHGPHFYESPSGMSLEIQYSYWIPKGHLTQKYKKYENK